MLTHWGFFISLIINQLQNNCKIFIVNTCAIQNNVFTLPYQTTRNMELSKQFYDVANSKVKPTDGEWGEGFWAGYTDGAQEMLNAVEAMLNNMLQDLYTDEEKQGIKDVLKYLPVVKPLNTEQK